MASEADMEPTQTQSQSTEVDMNSWKLNENSDSEVWGKLHAMKDGIIDIDLIDSTFIAGRADSQFAKLLPKKVMLQMSKKHFKLTKNLNEEWSPVFIEDFSRNGTYVNNRKLGQGNKRILKHNDVISVSHPLYQLFRFKHMDRNITDLPDRINNKYHVGRVLGSGACGTVFLVYDRSTCLPLALKQIKKHQLSDYKKDKAKKDRAKSEGDIMKTIKHPCVVKLSDFEDIDDAYYIALELMEGGDLLTRILKNKYLSESLSKLFFYQMCHALKYLHDRKITHRDLKPDNILLASTETETLVKISDFGLSKLCLTQSELRTMCGTPNYVAPEVLVMQGQGRYTEKVDVWSLGVVLYTCLSGTLPFSNDYGTPATDQIKKADFQFRAKVWNSVSAMAKSLVRELLTVDVQKRPSIDQLLTHEWLNDYNMKSKAHKIMNIAPPPRRSNGFMAVANARDGDFVLPYRVEEIRPTNDENAQPTKKRRIN